MWDSDSDSVAVRNYDNGDVTIIHGVQANKFQQKGQSWYVATDVPSDLTVQIGKISFHLHKFPLLSKCGRINRVIYESREIGLEKLNLDELPGGAEAFELAAKFCYGIAINLTATMIAAVRSAAEYLEMTEDLEEENLISKTEAFLNYVVLASWKDSILVLKTCEKLSPWAENLQIVRRCSESVAWKACTDPTGVRWQYTGKLSQSSSDTNTSSVLPNWWCEDVSILRIDHFVRVISAIKVKGIKDETVGAAIMHNAMKWIPGMMKQGSSVSIEEGQLGGSNCKNRGLHMIVAVNKGDYSSTPEGKHQRMIIESLISIIPPQINSVSCSFLLRLLRIAIMVNVSPALITELEKRAGLQLDKATLADLLIPCYSTSSETMYDVDRVQRLLEHFLIQDQMVEKDDEDEEDIERNESNMNSKSIVARLIDSYLAEISLDKNLSMTKFQVLAEAMPECARSCDDGLYRAVDSYLKAHPMLSEHERRRLCRVMDCQKLSMDACTHAGKNERLPIRVVVQVILSEQIKLHNALASGSFKESGDLPYQQFISNTKMLLEETPQSFQEGWASAKKDIKTLKFDLETVKTKYLELQHDMEGLQRQNDKINKLKLQSAWSNGWKKLSKITKITSIENTPMGSRGNSETTIKTPRRWRNSVS